MPPSGCNNTRTTSSGFINSPGDKPDNDDESESREEGRPETAERNAPGENFVLVELDLEETQIDGFGEIRVKKKFGEEVKGESVESDGEDEDGMHFILKVGDRSRLCGHGLTSRGRLSDHRRREDQDQRGLCGGRCFRRHLPPGRHSRRNRLRRRARGRAPA